MTGPAPPPLPGEARQWWETRTFAAALILLAAVPLLYPPVPPLVDLFGHMGRYRVQLDIASSPWLPLYYDFEWAAIGNLGVDLLIVPLVPLLGLELAVKLIVLSIPPLTVAGFLLVAREVHHRLPPTALFALPFAFGHPFLFGFVNYALSMAFAFLAFGLWLRLARLGKLRLRALVFVPISILVFFTHTYGWGALGLLCFSAEAVRQHDRKIPWFRSAVNAAAHAAVMALPLLIMIGWRSDTHGEMTRSWFFWERKWEWVYSALRDRWMLFDWISVAMTGFVLVFSIASRQLTLSRNLAFSALVLLASFIIIPATVFGSAYADMRLVPFVFAVALISIRFRNQLHLPTAQLLAIAGLAFFLIRLGGTTISLAMAADDQRSKLTALDHLPMGARVVSLVGQSCGTSWPLPRDTHLGAMVIVRRHGFSNDQWAMPGVSLLRIPYREAGPFAADPSQIVRPDNCPADSIMTIGEALGSLPREGFDYVWMIDPPPFDRRLLAGMQPVWDERGSALYKLR